MIVAARGHFYLTNTRASPHVECLAQTEERILLIELYLRENSLREEHAVWFVIKRVETATTGGRQ